MFFEVTICLYLCSPLVRVSLLFKYVFGSIVTWLLMILYTGSMVTLFLALRWLRGSQFSASSMFVAHPGSYYSWNYCKQNVLLFFALVLLMSSIRSLLWGSQYVDAYSNVGLTIVVKVCCFPFRVHPWIFRFKSGKANGKWLLMQIIFCYKSWYKTQNHQTRLYHPQSHIRSCWRKQIPRRYHK
jgi:hypothetical protein